MRIQANEMDKDGGDNEWIQRINEGYMRNSLSAQ